MTVQDFKATLEADRREIETRFRSGDGPLETTLALTRAMDKVIGGVFEEVSTGSSAPVSVLALGGYGRNELFPGSDVDLMVLCAPGPARSEGEHVGKKFLHAVWDVGLNVGHSVRTSDEVLELHGRSLDAWTSALEARWICGNRTLSDELRHRMENVVTEFPDRWLLSGLLEEQRSLHESFGASVKLLEPNVKKSAGGLRDLHVPCWLFRGAERGFRTSIVDDRPATQSFLDFLLSSGELDQGEHATASRALEFLFRVRLEMHFQKGAWDTLGYALQLSVAEGLGYGSETELRSVEVFMRDYYTHARTVHRLSLRLGQRFRDLLDVGHPAVDRGQALGEQLLVRDDVITVVTGLERFNDLKDVFDAFVAAAEHHCVMDSRLRTTIERSLDLCTAATPSSPELASRFRRILRSRHVAPALRAMNDLDLLGRYLPEFGRLVAFFQHNVYHYYTADEHTLTAIDRAEGLREASGYLHEVFRNLKRKDLLYFAVLLHDIAKPLGVADHEVTGVAVAAAVLQRIGMEDLSEDVGFLIRHHLVMEQVAFRRNIDDPATIRDFTARIPRAELLDYLYILTYADLSAVNPNVWTEWKASLLRELHRRAAEVLRRNLQGEEIAAFHKARHEEAREKAVLSLSSVLPRDEVERHLRGMQSPAYLSAFSDEEVAEHIREIGRGAVVSPLFRHDDAYSEVTIIGRDAPFALSRFCAVLAANDATIFDATIFTREDGIIIDHFRVASVASRARLEHRVCLQIADDLRVVMEGSLDVNHLFARHHRTWKRRPKVPVNPHVRTDVEFEDGEPYTIIDVYAADSVGFLYRITETMSRLGLDIYFAKIATRVDGIVDAFYVLDRAGEPVRDDDRRAGVRDEILRTIRAAATEELA